MQVFENAPKIENEEWRDVWGLEDLYEVSNMGRCRSKARVVMIPPKTKGGIPIQRNCPARLINSAHVYVTRESGDTFHYSIVRMIMETFGDVRPIPERAKIVYKDGDRENLKPDNLSFKFVKPRKPKSAALANEEPKKSAGTLDTRPPCLSLSDEMTQAKWQNRWLLRSWGSVTR